MVAGLLVDEPVHLLAHAAVRRVSLRTGAQLEKVHRLAGIELHDVSDLVRQAHGVRRRRRELHGERVVEGRRSVHGVVESVPAASPCARASAQTAKLR